MEDKNASYNKSLGIVSNIIKESFGEPTTKQDGGGPGYGLLQWTTGKDRYNKMMEYKTDSIIPGIDPELQRQAEFILNSIKDPDSESGIMEVREVDIVKQNMPRRIL